MPLNVFFHTRDAAALNASSTRWGTGSPGCTFPSGEKRKNKPERYQESNPWCPHIHPHQMHKLLSAGGFLFFWLVSLKINHIYIYIFIFIHGHNSRALSWLLSLNHRLLIWNFIYLTKPVITTTETLNTLNYFYLIHGIIISFQFVMFWGIFCHKSLEAQCVVKLMLLLQECTGKQHCFFPGK